MPRKPDQKLVQVQLTPQEYAAFRDYVELENISSMAEAIRQLLAFAIPKFNEAEPTQPRGKYRRKPST